MSTAVRPLAPGDIEAVAALEAACNAQPWSAEALKPYAGAGAAAAAPGRGGGVLRFGLVVEHEGIAAGYALASCVGDEAEILILGVRPASRRGGLATALLKDLLARLKAAGAASVFLEVRRGNKAARALYAALGFGEAGVRKGYYADTGEDALLLHVFLKR